MKKIIYLMGVTLLLISSCQSTGEAEYLNPEISGAELRLEFIKSGKSDLENKELFSNLGSEDQKAIWLSKLNQLRNENISSEINKELTSLIAVMESEADYASVSTNSAFKQAASNLVRLIPEGDFLMMFGSMHDYSFKGTFIDSNVSLSLIQSIDDLGAPLKGNQNLSSKDLPDCNCRWTCGDNGGAYVTENCEETTIGCGFLWLQSCKKREALY